MRNNKIMRYSMWISFGLAFIIRVIFCMQALPIRTLSDELATISGAAYAAGYDWSGVVSYAGYYGVGFTTLLGIFFKIFDNPIFIYRGMIIVCALIQSVSVFIVYYIAMYYFKIRNVIFVSMLSLGSSFFVVTRAMVVYNEHILIGMSWIVMILLFKLDEYSQNKTKKRMYTLGLMICLSYSLTIHTRALILWIGLLITIAFYLWTERKLLIAPGVFVISGVIGYSLSKFLVNGIQKNLWQSSTGQALRNASINLPNTIEGVFTVDKWKAWLDIIVGQINTINVFSGGLVALLLAVIIHTIWKKFVKGKRYIEDIDNLSGIHVCVFFLACVAMTIFAQSIMWLPNAAAAINEGIFNNGYGTKAFTYVRYMGPFCGPLFMIGCVWVYKKIRNNKSVLGYYKIGLAILVITSVYWVMNIVPYIHQTNQTNVLEVYIPFSLSQVFVSNASLRIILPATLIIFILYIIYGFALKRKKFIIVMFVIVTLLIYQYGYNAIYWDLPIQENNYYKIGYQTSQYIRNLQDNEVLPKTIYVQDIRDITDHQIYYELQFLLYDFQVFPIESIEDLEEKEHILIITNQNESTVEKECIGKGYEYYCIENGLIVIRN